MGYVSNVPSTGYVNLQQYLDANKTAGSEIADAIGADIATDAKTLQDQATKTQTSAENAYSGAAKDAETKALQDKFKTDASGAYQNASTFLKSGYSGPDAGNYTATLSEAQKALQNKTSLLGTQEGQLAALNQKFGKSGQYSSGFGLLDQFLLQGDQSGRDKLKEIQTKASDAGKSANDATTKILDAQTKAQGRYQENQKTLRKSAKSELENQIGKASHQRGLMNDKLDMNRIGAKKASMGDVLNQKQIADIQALSNIANEKFDPSSYQKTYNPGTERPGYSVNNDLNPGSLRIDPRAMATNAAPGAHYPAEQLDIQNLPVPGALRIDLGDSAPQAPRYSGGNVSRSKYAKKA
jgi:hypothetical protein